MKKKKEYNFNKKTVKTFSSSQPKLQLGQQFSQEQELMNEMFGSSRTFGTGQNLPKIDNIITSGYGLINNEDYGETSQIFGVRKI